MYYFDGWLQWKSREINDGKSKMGNKKMNLRDKILVDISKKTKLQLWMKISKSLGVVNTLEKKKRKKQTTNNNPRPKNGIIKMKPAS